MTKPTEKDIREALELPVCSDGFLAEDKIPHESEIFQYIRKLHQILWVMLRIISPGSGGHLTEVWNRNTETIRTSLEEYGKPKTVPAEFLFPDVKINKHGQPLGIEITGKE